MFAMKQKRNLWSIDRHQVLYIGLGVLSLCLAGASYVSAQESAPQTQSAPAGVDRERAEQAVQALTTPAEPSDEGALTTTAQERLINLTRNLAEHMVGIIDRFDGITDRLESRSDKMQRSGMDTAAADERIAAINAALREARLTLGETTGTSYDAITSPTPRTGLPEVSAGYRDLRAELVRIRGALLEAVNALKAANPAFRPDDEEGEKLRVEGDADELDGAEEDDIDEDIEFDEETDPTPNESETTSATQTIPSATTSNQVN